MPDQTAPALYRQAASMLIPRAAENKLCNTQIMVLYQKVTLNRYILQVCSLYFTRNTIEILINILSYTNH